MNFKVVHELPSRVRIQVLERLTAVETTGIVPAFRALEGVRSAAFSARTGRLLVEFDGGSAVRKRITARLKTLERAECARFGEAIKGGEDDPALEELRQRRDELIRSVLLSVAGRSLGGVPKAAFSLYGNYPFLKKGFRSARSRRMDADLLDATAIGASMRMGDLQTGSVITFLLRLGEYLRVRTEYRARRDLVATLERENREVWVKRDGREVCVLDRDVRAGDVVVVRAGHVVPVDGKVVGGRAMVDQSSLTGESLPVPKRRGTLVYEGVSVVEGTLEVEAQKIGEETRLSKIVRIIDQAETQKAASQQRALRLADKLVPYVFSAAGVTQVLTRDSARAASVLLVDYSCALKLAVPIAIRTCMMEAMRHGILIRGGKFIESMAEADVFIFDKTGTLTEARPRVLEVVPLGGFDREELIRDTACVEEHFPHPVAAAILREAERQGLAHGEENHGEVKYLVAQGIVSSVRGKQFVVGSLKFLERNGISFDGIEIPSGVEGHTVVYVGVDGSAAGLFIVEDPLRAEAAETVSRLKALGIRRTVLLTGDGPANARRVGDALGFDEVHSEVSPEDKARIVREFKERGHKVAMAGDGINDAPALSTAHVGISFQHGADLTKETADVLILRPDLRRIPLAIELSRRAKTRVDQNFKYTVGINSALIASAFFGRTPPALSALLHNATTVFTSVRSLRPYLTSP